MQHPMTDEDMEDFARKILELISDKHAANSAQIYARTQIQEAADLFQRLYIAHSNGDTAELALLLDMNGSCVQFVMKHSTRRFLP